MAKYAKTELTLDKKFDAKDCRHFINGHIHVLHCHHYASLYSQLADDLSMLDGKQLLADSAEDAFIEVLKGYFEENHIIALDDKISIAEQYYAASGLGKMKTLCLGEQSGAVELTSSHVDEGWIKKWGKRDNPVNFITCGYIAAMFSAIYGKPARSYTVREVECMVSGADRSRFEIVIK